MESCVECGDALTLSDRKRFPQTLSRPSPKWLKDPNGQSRVLRLNMRRRCKRCYDSKYKGQYSAISYKWSFNTLRRLEHDQNVVLILDGDETDDEPDGWQKGEYQVIVEDDDVGAAPGYDSDDDSDASLRDSSESSEDDDDDEEPGREGHVGSGDEDEYSFPPLPPFKDFMPRKRDEPELRQGILYLPIPTNRRPLRVRMLQCKLFFFDKINAVANDDDPGKVEQWTTANMYRTFAQCKELLCFLNTSDYRHYYNNSTPSIHFSGPRDRGASIDSPYCQMERLLAYVGKVEGGVKFVNMSGRDDVNKEEAEHQVVQRDSNMFIGAREFMVWLGKRYPKTKEMARVLNARMSLEGIWMHGQNVHVGKALRWPSSWVGRVSWTGDGYKDIRYWNCLVKGIL